MKIKVNFILIPFVVILISVLGGTITSGGMDWYKTIRLPAITPPGQFIGTVWSILFVLAIISALIVWNKKPKNRNFIFWVFAVNGALNLLWSFLFFGNHLIFWALLDAILLGVSVLFLIFLIKPISKLASVVLWPYFIWVVFASYLNYLIWVLNK